MAAIDAPHKTSDTTVHKGGDTSAERAGHNLAKDSAPSSLEQSRAAQKRPDTANLHDVKIEMSAPAARDASANPEIKKQTANYTPVVEKDKAGNTIYSKTPDGKGGFTDMRTAPDGTMTATEQNPNGDYTKHVISGTSSEMTTISHQQDGKGGFTDTTVKSDGTSSVHSEKKNGDFTETQYKGKEIESEKIRTMDGKGGYSETIKAKGSDVTKSYDSSGQEVPNKPPAAALAPPGQSIDSTNGSQNRPKPPTDAMGESANQADSVGGQIFDAARNPKTITNGTEVLKEVSKDVKTAADALKDSAAATKALQLGGAVAENLAKGLGNITPWVTGLQIAGVGLQAFEGDTAGALKNAGRMVFTKGAALGGAALATETSPLGMAAAGFAANQGAGRLWDGVADGSINRQTTIDFLKSAGDKFIRMADSPNFSD